MKTCRICERSLEIDLFAKRSPGVWRRECKECLKEIHRVSYGRRKSRKKKVVGEKACTGCGKTKTADQFRVHPSTEDGLDRKCKECMSDYGKSSVMKAYYEDRKSSGRLKETLKRYRDKNRDAVLQRARDRRAEGSLLSKVRMRMERLRERKEAIAILGGRCAACGEDRVLRLALDHVRDDGSADRKERNFRSLVRILTSGRKPESELQVLCFNCNMKKHKSALASRTKNDSPDDASILLCSQCCLRRPAGEFTKRIGSSTGRISYCKHCACEYNRVRRAKVLEMFGSRCAACGCDDPEVLEIDHVGDDGSARRRTGEDSNLYLKLVSGTRGKEGLQLLCANCNAEKAYAYNERRMRESRLQKKNGCNFGRAGRKPE